MEMMDFIGFTYNGKHSFYDLGIYRTIDGSRYNESITPAMTDKTADIPGGDGQYYFGTTFKNRSITINYAFDSLTEDKLALIKQTFSGDGIHELVFDETPYKAWSAKVTGTAQIKHICFEEDGERVYKGEGSLTFTCYYPYAHTPSKLWQYEGRNIVYKEADGKVLGNYNKNIYTNIKEWEEAANLYTSGSMICYPEEMKGEMDANFKLRIGRRQGYDRPTSFIIDSIFYLNSENVIISFPKGISFESVNSCSEKQYIEWDTKTGILTYHKGAEVIIVPAVGDLFKKFSVGDKASLHYFGIHYHSITPTEKDPILKVGFGYLNIDANLDKEPNGEVV